MADRYFIGAVDADWNDIANWSLASGGAGGASVPGASDKAIFDNNSPSCVVDVGFNPSIGQLELQGGGTAFVNTLDINDNNFITSGPVTVASGTLLLKGGSITLVGGLTQTGGTITHAAGGTLDIRVFWTKTGGVWNPSTGTMLWRSSPTINANGESLYRLDVNTGGNVTITPGTSVTITNRFRIVAANTFQNGTLNCQGDIDSRRTTPFSSPSTVFNVNGGGAQNFLTAGGIGYLPDLTVNKAGGTLTISNDLGLRNFIWTAGAVDFLTNTTLVVFRATTVITPGALNFYDVNIDTNGNIALTGTLTVTRDFELVSSNFIGAGTIQVGRHFTANSDPATVGNTAIVLNGTGAQNIDVNGGDLPNGNFTINKASGVATLIAAFAPPSWTGTLVVTLGVLDLAGFLLTGVTALTVTDELRLQGPEAAAVGVVTLGAASTVIYADGAGVALLNDLAVAFNNLTFGATREHQVTAGTTITITGLLASNGTAATRSLLRSTIPVTAGIFNLSGASLLTDNMDVRDNDASPGVTIDALGSLNSGGNTNWNFGAGAVGGNQRHPRVTRLFGSVGGTVGDLSPQGHCGVACNDAPLGSGVGGAGPGGLANMKNLVVIDNLGVLRWSSDFGNTWNLSTGVLPPGITVSDDLFSDGTRVYVLHRVAVANRVDVYRSDDKGQTFALVGSFASGSATTGPMIVTPTSRLIAPCNSVPNAAGTQRVAYSDDFGVTWTIGAVINPLARAGVPAIAVTPNGNVYAAINDTGFGERSVWRSGDDGVTFAQVGAIITGEGSDTSCRLLGLANNSLVMGYVDTVTDSLYDSSDLGVTWNIRASRWQSTGGLAANAAQVLAAFQAVAGTGEIDYSLNSGVAWAAGTAVGISLTTTNHLHRVWFGHGIFIITSTAGANRQLFAAPAVNQAFVPLGNVVPGAAVGLFAAVTV